VKTAIPWSYLRICSYGLLLSLLPALVLGAERNKMELLNHSGDAYVRQQGTRWVFGTAQVEKEMELKDGRLACTGFRNQAAHREYVQGDSEVFRFGLDGVARSGNSGGWQFEKVRTEVLSQGELLFALALRNDTVRVALNYIIYPNESIIQEWCTLTNISTRDVSLEDPYFLDMRLMQKEVSALDFSYMTGGMCFWGSWILKTSRLTPAYARHFASTDAPECLPGPPCPKDTGMGNSIYAPIYVFFNRQAKDGVFVGWDYMGRWAADVGNHNGAPLEVGLKVDGFKKALAPGAALETPKAFTGVFAGDLDEMGNQLKDYQYRYKWDYARPAYFPATRLLGYWWNGASDFDPKHPGADVEPTTTFRKMFRMGDLMRYVGGDVYWRDYGWWDTAGDWGGPDFGEAGRYLAKYGIPQTIYTIVYDAEQGSAVATRHPDWLIAKGGLFAGQYVLDQSKPGVTDFELNLLENQVRKWGDYEWRKDDAALHDVQGDSTPLLAQDQNFRRLLKTFLDRNPASAFHGCNGGGNDLGYEALRMAVVWQLSDGCVGRYRDYYASYLFPPDKLETQPDNWNPDNYKQASWRGQLWMTIALTGDTQDPAKLESIRQLLDIYHYLVHEGVAGRWVKVYHPAVRGDSPEWYLERLSSDNLRGIIIPSHSPATPTPLCNEHEDCPSGEMKNPPLAGPVTIYPKGLLPAATYNVSFQDSPATADRLGSELMKSGVALPNPQEGELIYLNLPLHPGSRADKTPPSAPSQVLKRVGTNMGYSGVELAWLPATDNNWVSYYEIFRNHSAIDKVAKGTYYFDHSLAADPAALYEVRAVDGSGNASPKVTAEGSPAAEALIVDDAGQGLTYSGSGWKHDEHVPQVYGGTLSRTRQAGDAVEFDFDGSRIAWYGNLGEAMGRADVYIDGRLDRSVDCYDADEIPNMALYARTFAARGHHKIKVVARGDRQWRASDNWVSIDGFKVGRDQNLIVEDPPGRGAVYGGAGWTHGDGWDAAEGKTVSWTAEAGDSVEYKFQGAGITWVGKLCPACGLADVYLDGALDATVNTYAPDFHAFRSDQQGGWQAPVYERSWTSPGEHTIRIVVRPDKDMSAQGHTVYLDAFQITGGR
jgi:hypothetical protein